MAENRLEAVSNHLTGSVSRHDCAAEKKAPPHHRELNTQTMQAERTKARFSPAALREQLLGGPQYVEMFDKCVIDLERDPLFTHTDYLGKDVDQQRALCMARVRRIFYYFAQDKVVYGETAEILKVRWQLMGLLDPAVDTRLGVHYGLFRNAIVGSGTDDQVQKYLDDINTLRIIGCFAMTEMGHGSNVPGIETTATLNRERDEFIVHSPTDTSAKWWIGGAAHMATHSVTFARLIIDGTDYGVHSFIVPLRDPQTHITYPGVAIGDCGDKMGRQGVDNGWIMFTNVRIPRENMLMRFAKVTKDGIYHKPPIPQLAFGALVTGRVSMGQSSAWYAAVALTISIRYAAVRRQFSLGKEGSLENAVLDYATHMNRLMPLLAGTYALFFASQRLNASAKQTEAELQRHELKSLNDTHANAAGMKCFATWFTHYCIDECRQSCGGHGYSNHTNLARLLNDFVVMAAQRRLEDEVRDTDESTSVIDC